MIPSDAIISSATMSLFQTGSDVSGIPDTVLCSLYTVTKDWKEMEATWTNASSGIAWNNIDSISIEKATSGLLYKGGQWNPNYLATANSATPNVWENYDVTTSIRDIHNGTIENYGFIIKTVRTAYTIHRRYNSSDHANTTSRPKLTIKYHFPGEISLKEAETINFNEAPGTRFVHIPIELSKASTEDIISVDYLISTYSGANSAIDNGIDFDSDTGKANTAGTISFNTNSLTPNDSIWIQIIDDNLISSDANESDTEYILIKLFNPTIATLKEDAAAYKIDSSVGSIDTLTYRIPIINDDFNDKPIISKDTTLVISEGAKIVFTINNNDPDLPNDTTILTVLGTASTGTATPNETKDSIVYTHNDGEVFADQFKVIVSDKYNESDTMTINITITPVNDNVPIAVGDTINVNEGASATVLSDGATSVLDNDTDVDGNSGLTVSVVDQPTYGALTLQANGTFTYTHGGSENFNDNFTYKIYDGDNDGNTVNVNIIINPINDNAPIAVKDSIFLNQGTSSTTLANGNSSVLDNDNDIDNGSVLSATLVSTTSHGSLTLNSNGTFSYTHNGSTESLDGFTYQVSDGIHTGNTVNVSIGINTSGNNTPIANNDSYEIDQDMVLTVPSTGKPNVLDNDTDDDTTLTVSLVQNVNTGNLDFSKGDGSFIYTPPSGFSGIVTFTYNVSDGNNTSNPATVTITVNSTGDTTAIVNTISIDTTYFIDSINAIQIIWSIPDISPVTGKYLQFAVSSSNDSLYAIQNTPSIWANIEDTINTSNIMLADSILFNTTYTIALWLRSVDSSLGAGTPVVPTESSVSNIETPSFTWLPFTINFSSSDTVSALNNTLTFINISGYPFSIHDTLVNGNVSDSSCLKQEFNKSQSTNFKFKNSNLSLPPTFLQMKSTIQAALKPAIFRKKDVQFWVIHDSLPGTGIVSDTTVGGVIDSTMLDNIFVVLSDNRSPILLEIDTGITAINVGDSVGVTIAVTDNNMNAKWKIYAGTGKEASTLISSGTFNAVGSYASAVIPSTYNFTSDAYGMNIIFIIDDGTFIDTMNISRQVQVSASDIFNAPSKKWIPIRATSELQNSDIGNIFKQITGTQTYMNSLVRAARWYDPTGLGTPTITEYSDALKSDFTLTPGKVVWLKCRDSINLNLGAGITNSLRENTKVLLKSKCWTDIAIPFKFDVKLTDIIQATTNGNSLVFYKWQKSNSSYTASPVYIPALDSTKNILDTIIYRYNNLNDAWIIYNPLDNDVMLEIPPISSKSSRYRIKRNQYKDVIKNISFNWTNINNDESGTVKIGCIKDGCDKIYGPIAPTFGNISVAVTDESNKRSGYLLSSLPSDNGMWYRMIFNNKNSSLQKIVYNFSTEDSDLTVKILDPSTGNFVSPQNDTIQLSGLTKERILVVGTRDYVAEYQNKIFISSFKLNGVYPNPFNGLFNLKFSIPWNNIQNLKLRLVDLKGRTIYNKNMSEEILTGNKVISINLNSGNSTILSSGVYILQVIAKDGNGKIKNFERILTCIK